MWEPVYCSAGSRPPQQNTHRYGNANVHQPDGTYPPTKAIPSVLGKFGTFVSYEVIDAPANVNYSSSYLFSNGPFYPAGAKVEIAGAEAFGGGADVCADVSQKNIGPGTGGRIRTLVFNHTVLADKKAALGIEPPVDPVATPEAGETRTLAFKAGSYPNSPDDDGYQGDSVAAHYASGATTEGRSVGDFNLVSSECTGIRLAGWTSPMGSDSIMVGDLRIMVEFRPDTESKSFLNPYVDGTCGANDKSPAVRYSFESERRLETLRKILASSALTMAPALRCNRHYLSNKPLFTEPIY